MIGIILAKKIISMFLILFTGVILVKKKVVRPEEGKVLSLVTLYVIVPCAIISSFQVEYTSEIRDGLLMAMAFSALLHVWFIGLAWVLRKTISLDPVEATSIIYPNAGNLVIPLVSAVLGPEWVIYTSAYMSIQTFLLWSHGKMLLCGEKGLDISKVITNVNMIAVFIGLIMFAAHIQLTGPVRDAVDSVSAMLGPLTMVVTGILVGSTSWEKLRTYKRLWLVTAIRLGLCPLVAILLAYFCGFSRLVQDGSMILLVPLLAAMAPSASSITQMAQVYGKDAGYASAINVVTTLLCVVTMPVMITIYQMLIG